MKRYKLLRDWPDSKVGDIFQRQGLAYANQTRIAHAVSPKWVESYPSFFEPIDEKDWEIESFRHVDYGIMNRGYDGYYHHVSNHGRGWCISLEEALKNKNMTIYSVIRESDGERFRVGDKVKHSFSGTVITIDHFDVNEDLIFADSNPNDKYQMRIDKMRPVLFTTEDGENICHGDDYWNVSYPELEINCFGAHFVWASRNGTRTFSTNEAAQKYVDDLKDNLTRIKVIFQEGVQVSDENLEGCVATIDKLKICVAGENKVDAFREVLVSIGVLLAHNSGITPEELNEAMRVKSKRDDYR